MQPVIISFTYRTDTFSFIIISPQQTVGRAQSVLKPECSLPLQSVHKVTFIGGKVRQKYRTFC
jgi:hypothetical protein